MIFARVNILASPANPRLTVVFQIHVMLSFLVKTSTKTGPYKKGSKEFGKENTSVQTPKGYCIPIFQFSSSKSNPEICNQFAI